MLKTISCEYFIQNQINFSSGLNVVLGDNASTNSIGKSTLLMIVDFVFGGSTYLEKDSGAIKEIGHHSFFFSFQFQNRLYHYSRGTENSDSVFEYDNNLILTSEITLKAYTQRLKELYRIENELTFRAMVTPYSRVWGKDNYNVDKPIQNFPKEAESTAVSTLIKLFNLYSSISNTVREIKNQEESKKILAGIHKKKYVEKITKTQFQANEKEINRISEEIEVIKNGLLKFTLNIEALSNKEVIELKGQKQKLLDAQSIVQNRINRLELNLKNKGTKSKYFKRLSEFFENPNESKIEHIELFHNRIANILKQELEASKEVLLYENEKLEEEISKLDLKISALLQNVDTPKFIIDKIYDLTLQVDKLKNINKFYEEELTVKSELNRLSLNLEASILTILWQIETRINEELKRINNLIHSDKRKVPVIKLKQKSYSFDHSSNTGTGKSFADLIEFDLAILNLTELPFIIHDSILFKNIENLALDKIIHQYLMFEKQIFIALDGINRYSSKSQEALKINKVIELSESKKLFNRDWR